MGADRPTLVPLRRVGRPLVPPADRLQLSVDCRFDEMEMARLAANAAELGLTPKQFIRSALEAHLALRPGQEPTLNQDAIRVHLAERVYDPLCRQAIQMGVTVKALIRAIVLRHMAAK